MAVLTVDSEMKWLSEARAEDKTKQYYCCFLFFIQLYDSRKSHYLTHEFRVKLHLKTDIGFRVSSGNKFSYKIRRDLAKTRLILEQPLTPVLR